MSMCPCIRRCTHVLNALVREGDGGVVADACGGPRDDDAGALLLIIVQSMFALRMWALGAAEVCRAARQYA